MTQAATRNAMMVLQDNEARFVECENHGRARALVTTFRNRSVTPGFLAPRKRTASMFVCEFCNELAPAITIKLRGNGSKRDECTVQCLEGKKSCDCKCGGFCHGLGTCQPDQHLI